MTAMAASNAVTPLIAPPAAAAARNDAAGLRGPDAEHFAQALQRRIERSENRPTPPQRPPAPAERPREAAPRGERAQAAEAGMDGAAAADAPMPGQAAGAAPTATEAATEAATDAATDEAAATLAQVDAAPLIAGLPASIAAILHNLAGQRGHAAAGEAIGAATGQPALPLAAFVRGTADNGADPLQNPAGRQLPAASEDGTQVAVAAADAKPLAADVGKDDFAARLQHALTSDGPTPTNVDAGTVNGVVQSAPSPAAARAVQMQVATPAGHSGWAEDVGNRVTLLVGRGESKAELVLTPPHLGRLEVSLTVDGDKTTAQFVAATPAARDALEQALPRLREVLQQAGVALGQADVSTSGEQHAHRQDGKGSRDGRGRAAHGVDGIETAGGTTAAPAWLRRSDGMVDIFA